MYPSPEPVALDLVDVVIICFFLYAFVLKAIWVAQGRAGRGEGRVVELGGRGGCDGVGERTPSAGVAVSDRD